MGNACRPNANAQTILVVDSDNDRLFETGDTLKRAGYQVLYASTAEDAEALFDANPSVGLVITRVVLATESGVHVANHVRDSGRDANTLMTSHFSRDLLRYVPGFSEHEHFLPNPFTVDTLLDRVRRLAAASGPDR